MIKYEHSVLENGLQVVVHPDPASSVVVVNVAYKVGSRDETPDKTGFAHLFEHLMFSGSVNIPLYDDPLQKAGGENNAFTTPDYTNYYLTVPAENIETGLWLESDRMLGLAFNKKGLEVQRKVVIEEFKQRYLNQPYGDVWHKLRALAYKNHSYQWPTIGKNIKQIEEAKMEDVRSFFDTYYIPNNAILVLAGNITAKKGVELANKWFGGIPKGKDIVRNISIEAKQNKKRHLEVNSNVPIDAFYKVYHMPGRKDIRYYTADLLSDILGRGKSSLLYKKLVEDADIFSDLSAYVLGSIDPGLLVISGKLTDGSTFENAEKEVDKIINLLVKNGVNKLELEKAKNQALASHAFGDVDMLDRAMNLAYGFILDDLDRTNKELAIMKNISVGDINKMAKEILKDSNACTMYYRSASN
ncbi:Zinc protease [hydrothermal vent metagenome]|uniref:Zinc protease n=1 Tax=hydrothermal vent metagenome TaxID=652676 RepID=A0A3B0ULW8_9ZZZZ